LKRDAEFLRETEEVEQLLMKHFIVDCFLGFKRNVAFRFFLGHFNNPRHRSHRIRSRLIGTVLSALFFIFCIVATVYLGAEIGSRATTVWLTVLLTAIIEDVIFIQPVVIFFSWVAIPSTIASEASLLVQQFMFKSRLVLMRTKGMLRETNALVQHFSPACRVARKFPSLPVCRLLLSLCDFDVPNRDIVAPRDKPYRTLRGIAMSVTFLPLLAQHAVIEIIFAILCNIVLGCLLLISTVSFPVAIIVLVFLLSTPVLREAVLNSNLWYKAREKQEIFKQNTFFSEDAEAKENEKLHYERTKFKPLLDIRQLHASYIENSEIEKMNQNTFGAPGTLLDNAVPVDDNAGKVRTSPGKVMNFDDIYFRDEVDSEVRVWLVRTCPWGWAVIAREPTTPVLCSQAGRHCRAPLIGVGASCSVTEQCRA